MAVALLANALATGFLLPVLILMFAPFSGAHFNPVVSIAELLSGRTSSARALTYILVQCMAAIAGVWLAHLMFGNFIFQTSTHIRTGIGQWVAEFVATFGLLMIVLMRRHFSAGQLPWTIGAYIAAAYFFTASTSFANPAVTLARSFTNTFAGIRPVDAPAFVVAQFLGMLVAWVTVRWFEKKEMP